MDHDTPENIAQTVAKIMEQNGEIAILDAPKIRRSLSDPLLIAVPNGQTVRDFTIELRASQCMMNPFQREGTAKLTTVDSLIEWANRFKGENSVIYAQNEATKLSLTCIADYHAKGAATVVDDMGDPTARHCHHRASYAFPLSKQWQQWSKISG